MCEEHLVLYIGDARAMSTNARSSRNVDYNVQTAVDTKHRLIVAHDVSMEMGDLRMLTKCRCKQERPQASGCV